MPHFYCKTDNYILSTNYKVLYSTLSKQPNLQAIKKKKHIRILLMKSPAYYLLVRNPYSKLESFYKDKLVNAPLSLSEDEATDWQFSQKVFFPYLDITEKDTFKQVQKKLTSTTFAHFIEMLPKVYKSEAHLTPQYQIEFIRIGSFQFRIKYNKILQIEDNATSTYLKNTLNIDMGINRNSTAHIELTDVWNPELLEIVNALYHEDFIRYGYTIIKSRYT